eukprot:2439982-Pyramimonas_sp.AAC.1
MATDSGVVTWLGHGRFLLQVARDVGRFATAVGSDPARASTATTGLEWEQLVEQIRLSSVSQQAMGESATDTWRLEATQLAEASATLASHSGELVGGARRRP